MPSVNVTVETEINAEPTDVASVMFDAQREPEWMTAVKSVELVDAALQPGARVKRLGRFMGYEFSWMTTVEAVHFPHLLVLRITDAPISGTVTYEIQRSGSGSVARVQNQGSTTKWEFIPSSMVEGPMRKAMTEDLARLKQLVESAVVKR
jgi:uncharacterized protein YndB with AHSA1/START domain